MNNLIGITGKMSSGKTTLVKRLKTLLPEYHYIDVDDFRRNLFNREEYTNELKKVIPELQQYKTINSIILNQYIYSNETYMKKYKDILYKYLFTYLKSINDKPVIVEWALILNDNLEEYFNKIIYVNASDEVRLNRLVGSDLSKIEISKRNALQEIDLSKYPNVFIADNNKHINIEEVINYIKSMECKFTLPEQGGKAIWEITHQCNYNCSYCIFSCNQRKIPGELTTSECFHVIDELVKNNFKHLKITGGEPFLRSDIIDILRYASTKVLTDISTNASLLTKEKVKLLNQLKLKMIHVSLDGLKDDHESVRGKNTFSPTIKGLEYLKESTNKVRIGCVIHKNNEGHLKSITEGIIPTGANEVIYSIMEPPLNSSKELMKTKTNKVLIEELEAIKREYQEDIKVNYNFGNQPEYVTSCPAGNLFLYIDNLGKVSPCPWVHEVNKDCITSISLRNHTIDEILEDQEIKKFLKVKKCGQCYGKIF